MIIRSRRVVLPEDVRPAAIHIQDGTITRIGPYEDWSEGAAAERYDAGNLVVSPGIVDTHVHINEPGRTDWEGFDTATRAAAAGGVTTVVDMPLNSVPATTTAAALAAKRAAARGQCHVDVAFWGGVVPGNAAHLDELVEAGVRGFKCFLVPSGVDEFPAVSEGELRAALPIIAARGVPLLVHAESPALINPPRLRSDRDPRASARQAEATYRTYLATRPPEAEVDAIRMVARLAREFRARVHIVHVASAEAADEVARAKADGVAITAETCPHYLTFAAEDVPDGATEFKCAPPIREARHREALWSALAHGTLDLVATDHSPAPPALKCPGDFMKAWGGVASLELSLATVWTSSREEVSRLKSQGSESLSEVSSIKSQLSESPGGEGSLGPQTSVRLETSDLRIDLCSVAGWMSEAPARLAGLGDRKGRIAPGYDADLVVWDPDAAWTVDSSRLQQRHKVTPYARRRLVGQVQTTFLRGTPVWRDGRLIAAGSGHLR